MHLTAFAGFGRNLASTAWWSRAGEMPVEPFARMTRYKSKSELAQRMHASGESASTIAPTFGVSRATVYQVLAVPHSSHGGHATPPSR
jgi:hypothetical protein